MAQNIPGLPEFIIIGMVTKLIPKEIVGVVLVQLGDCRVIEGEGILILSFKLRDMKIWICRRFKLLSEDSGCDEITQHISSVVVEVIKKEITDGGLWRYSF